MRKWEIVKYAREMAINRKPDYTRNLLKSRGMGKWFKEEGGSSPDYDIRRRCRGSATATFFSETVRK